MPSFFLSHLNASPLLHLSKGERIMQKLEKKKEKLGGKLTEREAETLNGKKGENVLLTCVDGKRLSEKKMGTKKKRQDGTETEKCS